MDRVIKKVCLLGNPAVGKTSLIRRFVENMFDERYIQTIGTRTSKKVVDIGENSVALLIWDILGQRFSGYHSSYYRKAGGALIVGDISRKETIESMMKWYEAFKDENPESQTVMVINKTDIGDIEKEKIEEILGMEPIYTSAKTGDGVEEAFLTISKKMLGVED